MPGIKHFLDQTQRQRLVEQHTYEKDAHIRDRIKAVLPYDKGWSYQKTAEALSISRLERKRSNRTHEKTGCTRGGV